MPDQRGKMNLAMEEVTARYGGSSGCFNTYHMHYALRAKSDVLGMSQLQSNRSGHWEPSISISTGVVVVVMKLSPVAVQAIAPVVVVVVALILFVSSSSISSRY